MSPVTLGLKLFVQSLWKWKHRWDETLQGEVAEEASKLINSIREVNKISFPRFVISVESCLHIFSDASSKAYGAAAYSYNPSDHYLLLSKSRVAPCRNKTLTIPKLELTAILIGCRLAKHLIELIRFTEVHLWTDSKVALAWIHTVKEIKDTYVSNRVWEIKSLICNFNAKLHFVPTKLNPADLITRGSSIEKLNTNDLWKHGPNLDDLCVENQTHTHITVQEITVELHEASQPFLHLETVKNYKQAHNIITCVKKLVKTSKSPLEILALQEQKLHTPSLYAYVNNPTTQATMDIKQTARQLNLVMINNIIKCHTRIAKSDLNEETHTPLFIPRTSKLVTLLVLHLHNKHRHCSVTQTITFYRQYAWTPKLRTVVSFLLFRCSTCQILRRRALSRPPPPELPRSRVKYQRPFEAVGVDNTGSMPVRGTVEGRRYLTVFVCTTTRNVHIEVTTSLSTDDFLHALRRFAALYGLPSFIPVIMAGTSWEPKGG